MITCGNRKQPNARSFAAVATAPLEGGAAVFRSQFILVKKPRRAGGVCSLGRTV